ncbi:hydantoinase B/oxoprolinase family protein [Chloroflexota bacterium]
MSSIDPVTVEIIQNSFTQIGREAGITMVRAAASLVVVGVKDLGFNIADHLGRTVVYSIWMPRHGTTLAFMLRSSLDRFKEREIYPGDMIMVNNPYDGALHVSDIAIIAPVHYQGEIIAWTGCATHHTDMRAMRPGFCPDATDWYQEGMVFSPIKIVERGELRQDIFGFLMDNVRMPLHQGLDLKAQIAANNVARDKIVKLVDRYGVATIKACYQEIIDFSEAKTRERISMLPDGRYEAVEYLDYDKVYALKCALIVKGDTLAFDFSGTDPQADSWVNSALACSVANVHNIVICLLLPDIPANEGCFRPVEVTIPERTVLNCKPPAPCSGASTIGGWKAQILAIKVLSQALAESPQWWRANASWGSGWPGLVSFGTNQYGKLYVGTTLVSSTMQGGGARATKDGFDVACIAGSTNTSVPNVEDTEQRYPFLHLSRSMSVDSGGPGKYRGGLSGEIVMKLHDVGKAEFYLGYVGRDVPASGFAGGQPGGTTIVALKRDSNVNELLRSSVPSFKKIAGTEIILPQKNLPLSVSNDDVLFVRCQGGGGYGDPLEREPMLVQKDVVEGYVSMEKAKDDYKVVLSPGSLKIELDATEKVRRKNKTKGMKARANPGNSSR